MNRHLFKEIMHGIFVSLILVKTQESQVLRMYFNAI